jgi:hypothetical protein
MNVLIFEVFMIELFPNKSSSKELISSFFLILFRIEINKFFALVYLFNFSAQKRV